MFRSVSRRILPALCRRRNNLDSYTRTVTFLKNHPRFYASSSSEATSDRNTGPFQSTVTKTFNEEEKTHGHDHEIPGSRNTAGGRARYQEEQAHVLQAALHHVPEFGWGEAAMIAGAKEVGVSPSVVGSFPRKDAALIEFFMDDCFERLIDIIESREDLKDLIPSAARVAKLVRIRLEMQVPYISKWPQALSIQAQPVNIPTSFKQRAMLIDEIWHASGDESTELDWYAKRTVLGGIYSTTELYLLTDTSPEFQDTWSFIDGRVRDAFELKKSVQEATKLAETVGAGMGGSLQGLMKLIFPN